MGYKLLNTHVVPPGNWLYRVPETGIEIIASSWPQLVTFVQDHYKSNAIKIPDNLEEVLVEFSCKRGVECSYNDVEIPQVKGTRSFQIGDVVRFSMSLAHGLTIGGGKVAPHEATKRAAICASCIYNRQPHGCSSCNNRVIKETVKVLSAHGFTPYDDALKSCEFCGCFIRSMVWFPIETLHKFTDSAENKNLPAHCWKKRPCTDQ